MSEEATTEEGTQEAAQETNDANAVAEAVGAEAAPAGWKYAEGVEGQGEAPDWFKGEKYATVEDQAKAYKDLEGRFGSFTGAPDEYKIAISDELKEKGVEIGADDPIMEEAMKFATEAGMNQDGFDNMVNLYAMAKVAESEAIDAGKADEIAALGANAQARLDNLNQWGQANLPEDLFTGFQEMAVSASAVQALEKLVAMTRNAPISPSETRAQNSGDEEELLKMQFEKDEHGNRKIQTDKAFKARYEDLKNRVWGNEDHRVVVGR